MAVLFSLPLSTLRPRTTLRPLATLARAAPIVPAIKLPHGLTHQTPLVESLPLSAATGCQVLLKMDALQPSGSFKDRGMAYMCATLQSRGVTDLISSSGGNAGLAASAAGRKLGMRVRVVVPTTTKPIMIEKMRAHGAEVEVHGANWNAADELARGARRDPEPHPHARSSLSPRSRRRRRRRLPARADRRGRRLPQSSLARRAGRLRTCRRTTTRCCGRATRPSSTRSQQQAGPLLASPPPLLLSSSPRLLSSSPPLLPSPSPPPLLLPSSPPPLLLSPASPSATARPSHPRRAARRHRRQRGRRRTAVRRPARAAEAGGRRVGEGGGCVCGILPN